MAEAIDFPAQPSPRVLLCARCIELGIDPPWLLPGAIITQDTATEAREHYRNVHLVLDALRQGISIHNSDEEPDTWVFELLRRGEA